jgi:L-ornithine N5-oxygenase
MITAIQDIAGIGFGPSNIALAICLSDMGSRAEHCYLEANAASSWQDQMMLDGSDIQNNPLRDFVTPRNPRSHFTFLNYLKEQGRLFEFLNMPTQYPLRREYASYVRWAADQFNDRVKHGVRVEKLGLKRTGGRSLWRIQGSDGAETMAKCLVLGTGRTRNIPEVFRPVLGDRVFHLNDYLRNVATLPRHAHRIGVVGASQSAVEILLDLLTRFPDKEIYSIQRGFGFRLKDVSPFSDRVYLPEFVDYFYNLPQHGKQNIQRQLRATNYSSADADVIQSLYVRVYEEKLGGKCRFHLLNNQAIRQAIATPNGIELGLEEVNTGATRSTQLDAVVLATGFLDLSGGPAGETIPPLLEPFAQEIRLDSAGAVEVTRDYRVRFHNDSLPPVYLNGLCEASHGFGDAGSFSLLSVRSETIATAALACLDGSVDDAPESSAPISSGGLVFS